MPAAEFTRSIQLGPPPSRTNSIVEAPPAGKPALNHGVFIGVGQFDDTSGFAKLKYTVDDAVGLAHVLSLEIGLIAPDNTRLCLSGDPTTEQSKSMLAAMRQQGVRISDAKKYSIRNAVADTALEASDPAGMLLMSFSTHGYEDAGEQYLMPEDGQRRWIKDSGIKLKDVLEDLAAAKSNKKIFIFDACRENMQEPSSSRSIKQGMSQAIAVELAEARGLAILRSCSAGQMSLEHDNLGHGVFVHFLIEGIRGKAPHDTQTGFIRLGPLSSYAADQTKEWVRTSMSLYQNPGFHGDEDARKIPLGVASWIKGPLMERIVTLLHGYTNGFGMRFVPVIKDETPLRRLDDEAACRQIAQEIVSGEKKMVLFSVWETRVQDFAPFAQETHLRWRPPQFTQESNCPAVNVNWAQATNFCGWLTKRERDEGRLNPNEHYWLPEDQQWSWAAGLSDEKGDTPKERSGKMFNRFPWGSAWPPISRAGNYGGSEIRDDPRKAEWKCIPDYHDGYITTAPVGQFAPNPNGLFDLSGNVWEWCEGYFDEALRYRFVRGGAWDTHKSTELLTSFREGFYPTTTQENIGFRCVILVGGPDTNN